MATTVDADDGFVLVELDGENSDPENPFNEPSVPSSAPAHSEAAAEAAPEAGTAAAGAGGEAPYTCPDLETIDEALARAEQAEDKLRDAKRRLAEANSSFATTSASIDACRARSATVTKELVDAEKQGDFLEDRYAAQLARNAALEKKLAQAQRTGAATLREVNVLEARQKEELAAARQSVGNLKMAEAVARQEAAAHLAGARQAQTRREDALRQTRLLTERHAETVQLLAEEKEAAREVAGAIQSMQRTQAARRNELDTVTKQVNRLTAELVARKHELSKLQARLQKAAQSIDTAKDSLQSLRAATPRARIGSTGRGSDYQRAMYKLLRLINSLAQSGTVQQATCSQLKALVLEVSV